jgi:predicted nucleic acid-binding protein
MRAVFADTCYWIGLLNPKDQTHDNAIRVSKSLTGYRIVTNEEVLTEFLNYYGARGPYFRGAAAKLVERMQADPSIQIVPQTHEGFLAGLRLYQARPDKGYSLTDCISMETVRREGVSEVLTNDEHFTQGGLTCLLERWLLSHGRRNQASGQQSAAVPLPPTQPLAHRRLWAAQRSLGE